MVNVRGVRLRRCRLSKLVVVLIALAGLCALLQAASTGTVALYDIQGGGAATGLGDYVSASTGLNTHYSFFIEVPPATPTLVVEIFDADIGIGGAAEAGAGRDRARGVFNTSVTYSLIDPTGAVVAVASLGPGSCPGCDNAWAGFAPVASPAAGHWELRVDQSSTVTAGDDINAIGVRAHDGTSGAGGVELNMYFHSYASYGIQTPSGSVSTVSRSYVDYPYVTSGCALSVNDFDWDSATFGSGSIALTNRTGTFTQTVSPLSQNDVWQRTNVTGYTDDFNATGYGLWRNDTTITATGDGQGNYGVFYAGAFNAPTIPPTAQPEANTFRSYLPTDAGGTPVRPYVEQLLTYVSGPNPPLAGMTTTVAVTVRVVNPGPRAIQFSSPSRLVTANVPGGGAVYGGNAQFTAGTILVSQPAVGGTGNVVWNPGTVAAGATVLLSYQVQATPAAGRLAVTGTPSLNGTTAVYLDDTLNLTQAAATVTFGPLCELAVTPGVLTHSLVAGFEGRSQGSGTLVKWRTSGEQRTVGFNLYRRDRQGVLQKLNRQPLPAVLQPQGGQYQYYDDGTQGATHQYLLEELESPRGSRWHGPYEIAPRVDRNSSREPEEDFRAEPRPLKPAPRAIQRALKSPRPRTLAAARSKSHDRAEAVKLLVGESGVYFVAADTIALHWGTSVRKVRNAIAKGRVSLQNRGREVAWQAAFENTGLFFFGEKIDSIFTLHNVYWLSLDRGSKVEQVQGRPLPGPGAAAFEDTQVFEVDAFAATVISPAPDSDYWYWEFLRAGDAVSGVRTFDFDLPGKAEIAGEARLRLRLQGATDSGLPGEHRVDVRINSTWIGTAVWQGITEAVFDFAFPQALLVESGNQLELVAVPVPGVAVSIFYVDSFDVAYQRRFEAVGGYLQFSTESERVIEVGGFAEDDLRLLDVTDPVRPREVAGAVILPRASGYSIRFSPSRPGRFVAFSQSQGALAPQAVPVPKSKLKAPRNLEYLVVTADSLEEEARQLADYRRRQGYKTSVVTVEAIMDGLNHGIYDPRVIRRYVEDVFRNSRSRRHRFLVLAGGGSLDYRDLLNMGGNLVPPLMIQAEGGLFASDGEYGDLDADGLPEIAVGRIPARTPEELAVYVEKLKEFEARDFDEEQPTTVLLADRSDGVADFTAESRALSRLVPEDQPLAEVYLEELGLGDARRLLFQHLDEGAGVLVYSGHGGPDRFSGDGLLTVDDVPALRNAPRLPAVFSMTCLVGRFELPGLQSLGELLVNQPEGGASAVLAPAGLSLNTQAHELAQGLIESVFDREINTVGEAVLDAFESFASRNDNPDLVRVYNILGDPAAGLSRKDK